MRTTESHCWGPGVPNVPKLPNDSRSASEEGAHRKGLFFVIFPVLFLRLVLVVLVVFVLWQRGEVRRDVLHRQCGAHRSSDVAK